MPVSLPDPVAEYVAGCARLDTDAILAPFAADAVVSDERRTHRGHAEIRQWIEDATIANQAVATPLTATQDGDDLVVTADVAGSFPGSPVTLGFRFTLRDGKIAALEIG